MLSLVFVLLAVVMVNGLGVFWPAQVAEVTLADGSKLLGQMVRSEVNPDTGQSSIQFKTGNREQDPQRQDFRWIKDDAIRAIANPAEVCVLERVENGDFYGYVKGVAGPDLAPSSEVPVGGDSSPTALDSIRRKSAEEIAPIAAELFALSNQLQETRGKLLRLTLPQGSVSRRSTSARSQRSEADR